MSKPMIEVKVIEEKYYDNETTKHETSPITVKELDSWKSAKAFNPIILNGLSSQRLVDALKKLF